MVQIFRSIAHWHGASLATARRSTAGVPASETWTMADLAAALEERRRRYLDQVLPSPASDAFVAAFLASPDGQADTGNLVSRLVATRRTA